MENKEIIEEGTTKKVEEVVKNEPKEKTVIVEKVEKVEKNDDEEKTGYVKFRVERAKEDAENELLKQLGVKSIAEAKEKMSNGDKALEIAQELQNKVKEKEKDELTNTKVTKLKEVFEKEKVFDADALVRYVDIEKVKIEEDGSITDEKNLIEALKKAKPNFFGNQYLKTDSYKKGNPEESNPKTYDELYKKGDYVGVITQYLNNVKK